MKYKTTIQITAEAKDKDEAMEIAGDYLSGDVISGVDMNCRTSAVHDYKRTVVAVAMFVIIVGVGTLFFVGTRQTPAAIPTIPGVDAIQAPLKTSATDKKNADFKKAWQEKRNKEALEYIKR